MKEKLQKVSEGEQDIIEFEKGQQKPNSNDSNFFESLNIDEDQISEDRIQREISQRYSIDERIYLIVNKQTGQVYDAKNEKVIDNIFKHVKLRQSNNLWNQYWKNLNGLHEKLIHACSTGNYTVLTSIVENESSDIPLDINFKSFDDWTPIHYATFNGKIQCLNYLLIKKANINQTTKFGQTALILAAKRCNLEAALLLLTYGCDVNIQDQYLYTALHYASEYGFVDMVKLLLFYEAKQTIKDCQGRTPKDASQNITIFSLFKNQPSQCGYSKSIFGGVLLPNSRKDHVEKFLNLTRYPKGDQNTKIQKKQKPKNGKFVNIIKMYNSIEVKEKEIVTVKDFIFYKLLGKGSFGEVYLVKKIRDQKYYAMKILKKQRVIGKNLFRYIQTEKDVLSCITHPFVVRLHYSFQNEEKLFLVMQYCEGGDLETVMKKKKKLTEEVAKIYVCQIILALEALHKNNIIYRDLKPENLVLDKDGHVLVTDFGLSKKGEIDLPTSSFCGTPAYIAPQIIEKKGYNRMVDWYQLGAVLYEFLVGTPPFYAPTKQELYKNKKQNFLKIPKNLSPQVKDLIKKLLHKDPNKRLGIQKDGESVREHIWFQDINWQSVYNKELKPPKIESTLQLGPPLTIKILSEGIKTEQKIMPDWTYIA